MAVVDIVIIVILMIGAIVGFCKGLVRSLFGFFATVGALVGAYFLVQPMLTLIQNVFDFQTISEGWFRPMMEGMSLGSVSCSDTFYNAGEYTAALEQAKSSGVLGLLFRPLIDLMIGAAETLDYSGGVTIGSQLAVAVASYVRFAIVFLVLFLLLRVLLFLVEKLLERVLRLRPLKTLDRLLGVVIGVAEAGIFILIVLSIAALAFPDPSHIVMQYLADGKIATWIMSWNPVPAWISEWLSKWIPF